VQDGNVGGEGEMYADFRRWPRHADCRDIGLIRYSLVLPTACVQGSSLDTLASFYVTFSPVAALGDNALGHSEADS